MLLQHIMMTDARVLLVGKDRELMRRLHATGRSTQVATVDPQDFRPADMQRQKPTAVVLSSTIPQVHAIRLCREFKRDPQWSDVPLLVMGARDDREDEVAFLAAGADDYLGRHTPYAVLAARLQARMRKPAQVTSAVVVEDHVLKVGNLTIRADSYAVNIAGKQVDLTAGEFRLLWKLAMNAGKVLSVQQILADEFFSNRGMPDRTVRTRVSALRGKLGDAGKQIRNHRQAGYSLGE